MKRFSKLIGYVLILAFFSVALSGCTKKTPDPGTGSSSANNLVVWSFEDADVWKDVKKGFEKKNTGINFVYKKEILDAGYENRVMNSILSGTGPDIWAMPNDWVFRHKDKLAPMPEGLLNKNDFADAVNQTVIVDDRIYATTSGVSPLTLYLNTAVIKDTLKRYTALNKDNQGLTNRANSLLGGSGNIRTWNDFIEANKILTKKNGKNIEVAGAAIGTDKVVNSQDILYLLMLQQGVDITNIKSGKLTQATFNLPVTTAQNTEEFPGQKALEFYTSFANPNNQNYTWNDSLGDSIEAFVNGKVAMMFGYGSFESYLAQKYPTFESYKRTFVPQIMTEPGTFKDYATFNAYGVSKYSGDYGAQVCWNLLAEMALGNSSIASATRSYYPGKTTKYDDTLEARHGSNPDKLEMVYAQTFIKGKFPDKFDTDIRYAIFAMNNGVLNSKGALDLAANSISSYMVQESW